MATVGTAEDPLSFDQSDLFNNLGNVSQLYWLTNFGVIPTWLNKYTVPFSLILSRWGLCFNFNMIESSKLLHYNETSPDFHYNANNKVLAYIPSLDSNTVDLNETVPWTASNNRRFLILYFHGSNYQDDNPYVERQGYHLVFHNNDEMPFDDEKNHVWIGTAKFVTVDFSPVQYEADDSLLELDVEE